MWHHELAKVYQVRQNLWAIDEIGKTTLYVYEGEKRVLLLDTASVCFPCGRWWKASAPARRSLWLTPMPMGRPRQRQLSV